LQIIRIALTVCLQPPADTVFVNDQERHDPSRQTSSAATTLVEPAHPAYGQTPVLTPHNPQIHAPSHPSDRSWSLGWLEVGRYRLRLAQNLEDRDAACRLRFRVFNIELKEGLASSYQTGLDSDHFDLFCEHLLVEDKTEPIPARRVVGTYRMQSGETAARNLGYYSEQEFNFASFEPLRSGILELGRAAIDREHRTPEVLTLLWRGIAQYANQMGLRYLIGCSSLTSKDPAEGWQVYRLLEHYRVSPEFAAEPTAAYACPIEQRSPQTQLPAPSEEQPLPSAPVVAAKVPKLLKTYLAIGARICGPPAWDREFGTIDFLTLLDLEMLTASARNRFLAPLTP
jgi:putative hemolysin